MRSRTLLAFGPPLLVACALAYPAAVGAQGFSADYALTRGADSVNEPGLGRAPALFSLGGVRVGAALQADATMSGAGLSLEAGRNWFGQVGVGRSLLARPLVPGAAVSEDVVNLSGGYRWGDGQSMSLQLSRGRGGDRLGLAVSYDWPRYFVRLSYGSGLSLVPQDSLRFSAGIRF